MQNDRETVVVEYIRGEREVPAYAKALVDEYRRREESIRGCASYPRSTQVEMDQLYDALVVIAR
jgi:hypothetical protein